MCSVSSAKYTGSHKQATVSGGDRIVEARHHRLGRGISPRVGLCALYCCPVTDAPQFATRCRVHTHKHSRPLPSLSSDALASPPATVAPNSERSICCLHYLPRTSTVPLVMKVHVKNWHAIAQWRWDTGAADADDDGEGDVCGICRVPYEGCCPSCKMPGDDCPLSTCPTLCIPRVSG